MERFSTILKSGCQQSNPLIFLPKEGEYITGQPLTFYKVVIIGLSFVIITVCSY